MVAYQALAAVPWAVVALVALLVLLVAYTIAMVRSARSNMTVRLGKIIEIRRGARDPHPHRDKAPPQRRLRSVDKPAPDPPADPDDLSGRDRHDGDRLDLQG